MQKKYLLAPGPRQFRPKRSWRWPMPMIHHRAPDFLPVLESAKKGCSGFTRPRTTCSSCAPPAPGGMVGSVNNFLNPGDEVITVNGGKFGERWTKICQAYGMKVTEIVVEWGTR